MADDRDAEDATEDPTGRRVEKSRDEGKVALSHEIPTLAVMVAIGAFVSLGASTLGKEAVVRLHSLLEMSHNSDPVTATYQAAYVLVLIGFPVAALVLLFSVLGTVLQTGFMWHGGAVAPDFSRISPRKGFGRLFGTEALVTTAKSLVKTIVVGAAICLALAGSGSLFEQALEWDAAQLAETTTGILGKTIVAIIVVQGVVAALDLLFVRYRHIRSLRMTRQEVRDEAKESDGDPHIRARLRALRLQRSRRRMLAQVPKATVVITNPTHYAVALSYEAGGGAPRIVAKGVDAVAARIREVARRNNVSIVANPPLARALYPLELDREIPSEFFKQVAEIIAYVWRLRGMTS